MRFTFVPKTMNCLVVALLVICAPFACLAEDTEVASIFPEGTFDEFVVEWYSGHLKAMDEGALSPLAKNKTAVVYRFTCLRTFHRPFAIKVTKTKDGFELLRKVLSGKGGYEPGKIEESAKAELKPEVVAELEKLLVATKFKDMKATIEDGGLDGSRWIVEEVRDGGYKVVDRWTPDEGSALRRIGEWFLDAAKWKPKELY